VRFLGFQRGEYDCHYQAEPGSHINVVFDQVHHGLIPVLPRIQPMRLTRVANPFDDPEYLFELKHDGFRAIAFIEAGECKLVSRNSNQFKSFVSLKESLGKIPVKDAILDGELSASMNMASASSTS
jgi:ATP-dependent DNA ligase